MLIPQAVVQQTGFSGARCTKSATTVPTGSFPGVAISFDTESYDTDAYHSTSVQPTRITFPFSGTYRMGGYISFDSGGVSAARAVYLIANGSGSAFAGQRATAGDFAEMTVVQDRAFNVGEYFEVYAYHESTGNRSVGATVWIQRIA